MKSSPGVFEKAATIKIRYAAADRHFPAPRIRADHPESEDGDSRPFPPHQAVVGHAGKRRRKFWFVILIGKSA
ncbi:MAG: hypothetical protein U5K69_14360 [Balneolaceae bacterium]|nr:hypothetical protein [Balneolaceae bacterium]